jgi:hypothetical protein
MLRPHKPLTLHRRRRVTRPSTLRRRRQEVRREVKTHIGAVADDTDPTRVDELRSTWAEFEYLYATGLDEGRTALSTTELRLVEEALERLRALITDSAVAQVGHANRH